MIPFKRILVPTDFSEFSNKALEVAVALAKIHEAELVIVHVVPQPGYAIESPIAVGVYAEIEKELREKAQAKLEKLGADAIARSVPTKVCVKEGSPFVEIIGTAREEQAELIVIATHGHTGVKHVLLGSTAEKVVRKAPCPVLTVKEADQEFSMP